MTDTYRDHPLHAALAAAALAAAAQARPWRLATPVTCLTPWYAVRCRKNRFMARAGAIAEGNVTP